MKWSTGVVCALFAGLTLATPAFAAQSLSGAWTLSGDGADKVRLTLTRSSPEGNSTSSSDWDRAELKGLDLAMGAKHDVHFTIARDAGRIEAEGFAAGAEDAQGAGLFRFAPNPDYATAMTVMGFGPITDDRQFALTVHDVSRDFARNMQKAGITGLTLEKLLAFRIHRVDATYVADLRAAGADASDAEMLIAYRIHGVTPEFVKAVHALGFAPDARQLVAMRIHRVTPEYIAGLKTHGLRDLTVDQIIRLRIHGIS